MKDRGRIKWSPFLIPEHKKRIGTLYISQDDVKKPELDEQMLDNLQEKIILALHDGLDVTITYYQGNRKKLLNGSIHKVDPFTRLITIWIAEEARFIRMSLQDILDIESV